MHGKPPVRQAAGGGRADDLQLVARPANPDRSAMHLAGIQEPAIVMFALVQLRIAPKTPKPHEDYYLNEATSAVNSLAGSPRSELNRCAFEPNFDSRKKERRNKGASRERLGPDQNG